ncbi:MAG: glycolate oxidase subunit GlcE [Nitrosomonadales bacterium]|nr:glycolate oxidase subunit GlcE [Nitrosomonadales bacterium]
MGDNSNTLQQQVLDAYHSGTPLNIAGSGSKAFLSNVSNDAQTIDVTGHRGIVEYDPRELVLTARSGTTLQEIEAALAEANQMLPFEPPHFGGHATLGGTIACGLSGPRRPYSGSARDFVLGCQMLNGRGELLRFGGQVMKNVAGYDVSRLMAGAQGTLGVLLDISLKVLPRPAASTTVIWECSAADAIASMSALLSKPYPVDGACYHNGQCHVRISGSAQAVRDACTKISGDVLADADAYWHALREQQLTFFQNNGYNKSGTLYRVVVKPATPQLDITGDWLLDWGGAQRWLYSDADIATIRQRSEAVGGHVTVFRGGAREIFQPLPEPLLTIHRRLKASFDPNNIFNRGRLYANL